MRLRSYLNRVYTVIDSRQEILIESLRLLETVPDQEGLLEGRLRFWDGSLLEFVEVIIEQGVVLTKTDYAYHYQDAQASLIFRYDNAPHHPEIATYPHHKHTLSGIEPAAPPDFGDILREIDTHLYLPESQK
ncbi:MAG: hypothetical protein GY796_06245 [Chloroflexi bacterium]|nr:hypothetical protein [Chloroflexota bacterium]